MKHFLFLCRTKAKKCMETLSEFATVFGNGFFPIIVCCVMFYILTKQLSELKNAITKNTEKLTELITLFKTLQ